MSDIDKLLQVFIQRGPFKKTSEKLASLSTIHTTPYSLNTDNAHNIGKKILTSMIGHSVALSVSLSEYRLSQKNQVMSLASAVHVKTVSGERIELNPHRLYQRLLVAGISWYSHMLMRTTTTRAFSPNFTMSALADKNISAALLNAAYMEITVTFPIP